MNAGRTEHQVRESEVGRRTIVQGAAWTVPLMAVAAVSTPSAAASPRCVPNGMPIGTRLTATESGPQEAPENTGNGTNVGGRGYVMNSRRTLTFTATFTNAGTTIVPGGSATIQLEAPYYVNFNLHTGYIWETATVLSVTSGYTLTQKPTSQWVNTASDSSRWNGFNFTIDQDLPPGTTITVVWRVTAYQHSATTPLLNRGRPLNTAAYQTYTLAKISGVLCDGATLEFEAPGLTFGLTPGTS